MIFGELTDLFNSDSGRIDLMDKMWLINVLSVLISLYLPPCYSVDSAEVSLRNPNQPWTAGTCIDIPQNLTLCQNIGYSRMLFPNLLKQEELDETIRQSRSWIPLLNVNCHPSTKMFLCSLFTPVCLNDDPDDRPVIWPCRSLCEDVKASCVKVMLKYGFEWPEMVRCDKFPANSDLCISAPPNTKNATQDLSCSACGQPKTFEAIIHNYCISEYAIKGKISSVKIEGDNKVLYLLKKKKILKAGVLTKKDRKRLKPFIEGGKHCECNRIGNFSGGYYLIMGSKRPDGNFTVTFLSRWSKKDENFKRAYRHIRKGFECGQSILDLNNTDNKSKNRIIKVKKEDKVGKGNKSGKGKGKNRKKGKKKKRRKGKKKNKKRKNKKNKKRKNRKKGRRSKKQKKQKNTNSSEVLPGKMAGGNKTNGSNKP